MQLLDAEELVLACQSSPPVPAGLCNRWALRSSYLPACRGRAWQFPYPVTVVRFHAPRIPRARFALGRLLPFRLPVAQANGCVDDVRFWSDSVTLPPCPGLPQSNARAHAHALPRILPLVLHRGSSPSTVPPSSGPGLSPFPLPCISPRPPPVVPPRFRAAELCTRCRLSVSAPGCWSFRSPRHLHRCQLPFPSALNRAY